MSLLEVADPDRPGTADPAVRPALPARSESAGSQAASQLLRSHIRDDDFLARIGGDEFGFILTHCPMNLAPTLAGRINSALDQAHVPASLGWAPLHAVGNVQRAVEVADQAMYQAKAHRRVALATQP